MGRPGNQTAAIIAQDQQRLLRIMLRAQKNVERPRGVNMELIACLNRAIAILANHESSAGFLDAGAEVNTKRKKTG